MGQTQITAYYDYCGFIIKTAVLKESLGDKYSDFIDKLTIKSVFNERVTYIHLYKHSILNGEHYIQLPRSAIKVFSSYVKVINKVRPKYITVDSTALKLHENQSVICQHLIKHIFNKDKIMSGGAACVLNLQAGLGKTFVAAGLISALRMRTLYVVLNVNLAQQAVSDLTTVFGDGVVCKVVNDKTHKKILDNEYPINVCIINTAMLQEPEFFRRFSFVVIDEIHTMCSESRRELFWRCQANCILGLSATTDERNDELDIIYKKLVGEVIYADQLDDFTKDDVKFSGVVKVIHYYGHDDYVKNLTHDKTGKIFVPYMIEQFMKDKSREALIIRELLALYDKHNIYIFCSDREPLIHLRKVIDGVFAAQKIEIDVEAPELDFPELSSPPPQSPQIGTFIGGIKDNEINHIKSTSKIILTTYGYSSCGVSIVRMSAIIFVSPRKSNMKQILARIMRRGGDTSVVRRVIDIVDERTVLKHQLKHRVEAYEFYGFKIKHSCVRYTEFLQE